MEVVIYVWAAMLVLMAVGYWIAQACQWLADRIIEKMEELKG